MHLAIVRCYRRVAMATMSRMTGYIPTLDQIDELHKKIAPSQAAYDLVHTHCVVVATIARQLARHQKALFTIMLGQGSGYSF